MKNDSSNLRHSKTCIFTMENYCETKTTKQLHKETIIIFFRHRSHPPPLHFLSAHALDLCSDRLLPVCFALCPTPNLQFWPWKLSDIKRNGCISWYNHNFIVVSWRGFSFRLMDWRACYANKLNTAEQSWQEVVFNFSLLSKNIYSTTTLVLGLV